GLRGPRRFRCVGTKCRAFRRKRTRQPTFATALLVGITVDLAYLCAGNGLTLYTRDGSLGAAKRRVVVKLENTVCLNHLGVDWPGATVLHQRFTRFMAVCARYECVGGRRYLGRLWLLGGGHIYASMAACWHR